MYVCARFLPFIISYLSLAKRTNKWNATHKYSSGLIGFACIIFDTKSSLETRWTISTKSISGNNLTTKKCCTSMKKYNLFDLIFFHSNKPCYFLQTHSKATLWKRTFKLTRAEKCSKKFQQLKLSPSVSLKFSSISMTIQSIYVKIFDWPLKKGGEKKPE